MSGLQSPCFEQLTQAPSTHEESEKSRQIWKLMAYGVPCSKSSGEVLLHVYLTSRHLHAFLPAPTATKATASREL